MKRVTTNAYLAFLTLTDAEHCRHSLVEGIVHRIYYSSILALDSLSHSLSSMLIVPYF